jgi:RND family efflux transporter MFP subunit
MIFLARTAGLLAACALLAVAAPAGAQQRSGPGGPPAAPVVVAKLKEVSDAPKSDYTGLIQPATRVLLSAEVAGRLKRLRKKQGDAVIAGEVVAELENLQLEDDLAVLVAHMRETEVQLHLTENQQERTAQLFAKKLISAQQYEDGQLNLAAARARVDSERAQVKRLHDQLGRMTIRSPTRGQVVSSNLEVGQWVTPNQPIFEVFNYEEYEVLVGVPGRLLPSVPESGPVTVEVPEVGATLHGNIQAVVRHVDSATGNFTLRVQVANRDGLPLSGMLARVRLPLTESARILTVPRDAVVRRGDRTHVVIVGEDNTAQIVPVQVKGNFGDSVIVTGPGLKDGMPVVVRGNERLFPGTLVRIADSQPDPASRKL